MWMREYVNTKAARTIEGPWSQGVRIGPFLYTSGQVPINPASGRVDAEGAREQARQSLLNIQRIVEGAGGHLSDLVKTSVYLIDYGDFAEVNAAYHEHFAGGPFPARTLVTVASLPAIGGQQVRVIIEGFAVVVGDQSPVP